MLPGGMNDLTLDGGRALRLAAVVVLVVLAVITLPDLFKTPEPPPIPADVGFRPGETVSAPPPVPKVRAPAREKPKREKDGKPRPDRPPEGRNRPDRSGRDRKERPEAPPAQASVATPQPVPAAPPPVYVPPPPPAPAPVLPADGSEEFAPGRPG